MNFRQAPHTLTFDGQSLNNVGGYPSKVRDGMVLLGGPHMPLRNEAKSGWDWEELTIDFTPRTSRHAKVGAVNALLLNGGNAGCANGDSATLMRTRSVAYADLAFAAGFSHVLTTTIPSADVTYYDSAANTERLAYNSTLMSTGVSSGDFSAVVDIAGAIDAVADPDGTDPTYYADLVHWTAAGAQVAADEVAPAVITMLGL